MVGQLIVIQYLFFILSVVFQENLQEKYPTDVLLGIGYFQTLSIRSAGFVMMDLRELNQGLLFIYFIMMYISAFPLVSTLQGSSTSYRKTRMSLTSEGTAEELKKVNPISASQTVKTELLLPSSSPTPSDEETLLDQIVVGESKDLNHHQQVIDALKEIFQRNGQLYHLLIKSISALMVAQGGRERK